jgi:hypothetical protein
MGKIIFKNYFVSLIVAVLMLGSFLIFARIASADTWTTLDMPVMPGVLRPMSFGISGTNIVGTYDDESANQHGFLYNGTTWVTLDVPGSGAWDTNITDIDGNNIIGYYIDGSTYHGALYSVQSDTWTNIDAPGAISTTPNSVSGNKIVGNYYDDFERHGFLYDGMSWTNIDMPGAIFTQPLGVDGNNIVGYYIDASSNQHGFLYNGTTWTTFDAPGAVSVTPNDIDGNNIVGSVAYASGVELSFIYDGKTWKTFHIPGATIDGAQGAQGIDDDRIIGYYGFDELGYYHGFLYTISGSTPVLKSFWSQIERAPNTWSLRKTPGTQNKSADDVIKTVPNSWVVKIASTTDENGNNIDLNGYRWYKVFDATDGAIGWMAAESLIDGAIYLNYNQIIQNDLESKANVQLDTKEKRTPVILSSVDNYFTKDNLDDSLYGGGGGFEGNNNFQRFIQGSNFSKELFLAIVAQESGHSSNNETCSGAKDGGVGIVQMTSAGLKGLGSGLKNYAHLNDCNAKWVGDSSEYYSNASQGIYANIKDGFRTLQDKYRQKCPQASTTIDDLDFTCQDIEKILIVWGYNGFGKDENGDYKWHYLKNVSNKLENLSSYFPGVVYEDTDFLVEKLKIADKNKLVVKLYSPGNLQIIDSQGRGTGLFAGVAKEEIPNSLYESESEAAAVFFPSDSFAYQIVGNAQGVYDLSIDSTNNEATSSFNAVDIPTTAGTIYQYIVNWDVLTAGGKGVTVKVDQNGDGIFDYQFTSGPLLHDKTAPVTTAQLTGIQGQNNWHTSDVQVSLSAQDNVDGVGVLKTEYSLDGGITWIKYAQPFNIYTEGINTLLYRSSDFLGNIEANVTQIINIDKTEPQITITSPEAQTYFNNQSNIPIVYNVVDNLTSNPEAKIFLDGKEYFGTMINQGTYLNTTKHIFKIVATDQAGNSAESSTDFAVAPQAMESFNINQMNIFWGLDCQDLQDKLSNINILLNLQENQLTFPNNCLKDKNHFVVSGNFELPTGYQRQNFDKSSFLQIKISGIDIIDKVTFKGSGNVWSYKKTKNDSLNQGMDIKTAIINWSNKQVGFFFQGELNNQWANIDTLSPYVTTTLEIPLSPYQSAGSLSGTEVVKNKKLNHSWFYRFLYLWTN